MGLALFVGRKRILKTKVRIGISTVPLPGGRLSLQSTDSQQVVRGFHDMRREFGTRQAAEAGFVQPSNHLHPPKDFFDPFPSALTERIARMPGGASIQARRVTVRDLGNRGEDVSAAYVLHFLRLYGFD